MKTQTFAKLAYYILLLGWFPFMFVCATGFWLETEYRVLIAVSGLGFCLFGAMMLTGIFRNDELFKSIDELEDARWKYIEATKRLEQKIKSL